MHLQLSSLAKESGGPFEYLTALGWFGDCFELEAQLAPAPTRAPPAASSTAMTGMPEGGMPSGTDRAGLCKGS